MNVQVTCEVPYAKVSKMFSGASADDIRAQVATWVAALAREHGSARIVWAS